MYYEPGKEYGWAQKFAWCVFCSIVVSATCSVDWFRECIPNVTRRKNKDEGQILCAAATETMQWAVEVSCKIKTCR